jgi:nitrite reductase/ring-hydroxylating ferredoxin subunit
MSDIETLLRERFSSHRDSVTVDGDLLDGAITRGARRIRRRQVALGGAAASVVVALVASLAVSVPMRGTDESDPAAGDASPPWWSVADIADPSIFPGDSYVYDMMPWQDRLVVLGGIDSNSGEEAVINPLPEPPMAGVDETGDHAWITDDGVNWERRRQDLPSGCGFLEGVVALGDRLVVPCKIYDTGSDADGSRIGLATTSDLESWTVTPITDSGEWWFSVIGEGPDGTVVVQANEGGNTNNTRGFTMRTWMSSDLETWTPVAGETPDTMVDGSAAAIRTFGDHIVVTGVFYDYGQAEPDGPANQLPAIWVSEGGAPFVRTLLGAGDGSPTSSGAVMDIVATDSGYVAVGTAGTPTSGVAWTSADLVDWTPVTVAPGVPVAAGEASGRGIWDVEVLTDGMLLAAGTGHPGSRRVAEGWRSDDGGANWQSVGVGPDRLAMWNDRAVGMNGQFESHPTFWTWGGDSPAPSSSVDLGAADHLEVGGVRWHAEHQLFLVRTDEAVMAFAQASPKQGCRLLLATDYAVPDFFMRDGAVFSDPCHGATFAIDGTRLGGPSPRDLDQYRVDLRQGRITVDTTRLLTSP